MIQGAAALRTTALVRIGEWTNRSLVLPLLVFYPTSRCNSRCVSCDWWKATGDDDLTIEEIDRVAASLAPLGTRVVVFSGGEPLVRPDLFDVARCFLTRGLTLHLLTSGILLERLARDVARSFARVVVSLDASTETRYQLVRGVAALAQVERGVAALRRLAPELPVTARATLHRLNFRELPRLIDHARAMSLDGVSFLAADVTSSAFGRSGTVRPSGLALSREEVAEFEAVVEQTIRRHAEDFRSGFVAESPDKLRRLPAYYAALAGRQPFPPMACNAPWMSVVVEAEGSVRPCFFHPPIGNVRRTSLQSIVRQTLPAFRRDFDPATNPTCARCVCSMKSGWRHAPWQ